MLVLIGPSASGKTEVSKKLIEKYGMKKLITCTTRPMRINEVNDVDYHFLSVEDFKKKISLNEFAEWQEYNGNYYGSLKSEVDIEKVVILEPQGFYEYLKLDLDIYSVFLNIDKDVRFKRMLGRGDGEDKAKSRIKTDEVVFTDKLADQVDLVFEDFSLSVEEIADYIYLKYKGER